LHLNHAPHTIRPGTTGLHLNHVPHNERSYHARHNGHAAQRAYVPRLHNGRLHDGAGTTRLQDAAFSLHYSKKRAGDHASRTPNGQGLAAASRPSGTALQMDSKRQKSPDLGAKRSATTRCSAATPFQCICYIKAAISFITCSTFTDVRSVN